MRRKQLVILIIFIFSCLQSTELLAQYDADSVVVEEPTQYNEENDNSNHESGSTTSEEHKYERVYMDEYKLEAMRKKKEFQYPDMDSLASKDTLVLQPPQTTASKENRFEGFDANILVWLVIAIAIIIIILQLAGVNMRQLFSSGNLLKAEEGDIGHENIHEIPYESAIRQAILAKNYSLATRLMYLQGLKLLSDKELITWHENKTNWQYVYELKNEKLRNSFRVITHIFEYVQYGHMPLSEGKFAVVQESFRNFQTHVI